MGRKINSRDVSIRVKAWVKRSRIVIWLIRFFRARWHNLVLYTRLCQLYGWRMTLRLYRIKLVCRQRGSLVNNRLQTLARRMARDSLVAGSAVRAGWLYHDYPLPETQFFSHRENSTVRVAKLKSYIPLYKARVLDLGCSSGGISIGLALLGASRVTAVDYDPSAISIGQAVAEKYEIDNIEFHLSCVEKFPTPEVDVVIWLSQWMCIVKQRGLEFGKNLLFEIPSRAGAQFMAFESAADDGKAAIPGITQKDIEKFLRLWTPFTCIKNVGPFADQWREPGQERMVFMCSEPRHIWEGKDAIIRRVDRFTVKKEYKEQRVWVKDLEAQCLRRLDSFSHFPSLVDEGENWIKMEWAGIPVTRSSELDQLQEIVKILSSEGIIHRDICPANLLIRDGQLSLIDFGWAVIDGKETPVIPPKGLGRGFYVYGEWDDKLAIERVRAWFEKQI